MPVLSPIEPVPACHLARSQIFEAERMIMSLPSAPGVWEQGGGSEEHGCGLPLYTHTHNILCISLTQLGRLMHRAVVDVVV